MTIFLCVGTIAELIKLAPVVMALRAEGVTVCGIATGQNDLTSSDLYQLVFPEGVAATIVSPPQHSKTVAFFRWAVICSLKAVFVFREVFRRHRMRRPRLIVHGDTVSTFIGAFAGWLAGARIVHVEAGLRSFHLFRPFPEELSRVLVSWFTSWAFCPGQWAVQNLRNSGIPHVINTEENTLVDAMRLALAQPFSIKLKQQLQENYFIFVCHRQENLFDTVFLTRLVQYVIEAAESMQCVCIMHRPTEVVFRRLGLLEQIESRPSILILPRQGYVEFTHLMKGASFVITDGGSNQEECAYLGMPCLLLRKETERQEGLGQNVVLSAKEPQFIQSFFAEPSRWKRPSRLPSCSPSQLIATTLLAAGGAKQSQ